jgi:hypothetical protein
MICKDKRRQLDQFIQIGQNNNAQKTEVLMDDNSRQLRIIFHASKDDSRKVLRDPNTLTTTECRVKIQQKTCRQNDVGKAIGSRLIKPFTIGRQDVATGQGSGLSGPEPHASDALPPPDSPPERVQQKIENFEAAMALNFAYYNLVKTHDSLKMTLAIAAGIEKSHGTIAELVERCGE